MNSRLEHGSILRIVLLLTIWTFSAAAFFQFTKEPSSGLLSEPSLATSFLRGPTPTPTAEIPRFDLTAYPTCTFDQLYSIFSSRDPRPSHDESRCWSLQEEILRVPTKAIANFDSPEHIGNGNMGSVSKVVVALHGNSQTITPNEPSYCVAAMKTDFRSSDFCTKEIFPHPTRWFHKQMLLSCIDAYVFRKSYLGAEYTASMAFYAQRRAGIEIPGLLPTWAVVQDGLDEEDSKAALWQQLTHRFLLGRPHTDVNVRGVLMPLRSFDVLADINQERKELELETSSRYQDLSDTQLSSALLTAAQGLEFLNSLGLASQDMLSKNVGILSNHGSIDDHRVGVLYDNSFIGWQQPDSSNCPLPNNACNVCPEKVFPSVKRSSAFQDDFIGFRNIVVEALELVTNQQFPLSRRIKQLSQTTSLSQLMNVLKELTSNPNHSE